MTIIIDEVKLDYKDVLLMPKRAPKEFGSRADITLERSFKFKHTTTPYTGVPIIAANMDHTGTMKMADAFIAPKLAVALHKFYKADELRAYFQREHNPHTFYSMGIADGDFEKFRDVMNNEKGIRPSFVCIDVANGYSRKFVAYVERIREQYSDLVIMAGNVVTPDMTYDLIERGADIVKIGIGPGSVCTTRKITGVGYPQLSAVLECADAAHGANGLICADGGITEPGDIAKAFGAGADFVMCGGLFAGHTECEGELIGELRPSDDFIVQESDRMFDPAQGTEVIHQKTTLKGTNISVQKTAALDGKFTQILRNDPYPIDFYKPGAKMKFYGMSSKEAMDKHYGGKADYRASEGKAVEVPFKGSIVSTVEEILGGLRSACTLIGARSLKQLPKCATFVRVNRILNDKFE